MVNDSNALEADTKRPILALDESINSLYIYYACDTCFTYQNPTYITYLSRLDLESLTMFSDYESPNITYYDRPWSFYCQMDENTVYFRTLESDYIGKLNIKTFEIDNYWLSVPSELLGEHWLTVSCDNKFSPYLFVITFYNPEFYIYDLDQQTWTQGSTPKDLNNNFQPVIINQDNMYYTQSYAGDQVEIDYVNINGDAATIATNSFYSLQGTNQIIRVYECAFIDYNDLSYIHFIGGRKSGYASKDAQLYQIYDINNDNFVTSGNQLNWNRDGVGCIAINGTYFVFGGWSYIPGNPSYNLNTWEYYIASPTMSPTMDPTVDPTNDPTNEPTNEPTTETPSTSPRVSTNDCAVDEDCGRSQECKDGVCQTDSASDIFGLCSGIFVVLIFCLNISI